MELKHCRFWMFMTPKWMPHICPHCLSIGLGCLLMCQQQRKANSRAGRRRKALAANRHLQGDGQTARMCGTRLGCMNMQSADCFGSSHFRLYGQRGYVAASSDR